MTATRGPFLFVSSLGFTLALLALAYFSFGIWTALIFSSGFLGGFVLWAVMPIVQVPYARIKGPYWLTMVFFIFLHKVEENVFEFQKQLSLITKTPVPELNSPSLILLLLISVGAWLLIPLLIRNGFRFGYYLAWTFFAAMGITELAHFILPLFTGQAYGYFPGMISVLVLAPSAWWGMLRLSQNNRLQVFSENRRPR